MVRKEAHVAETCSAGRNVEARGNCPPCLYKKGQQVGSPFIINSIIGNSIVYQDRSKFVADFRAYVTFKMVYCTLHIMSYLSDCLDYF